MGLSHQIHSQRHWEHPEQLGGLTTTGFPKWSHLAPGGRRATPQSLLPSPNLSVVFQLPLHSLLNPPSFSQAPTEQDPTQYKAWGSALSKLICVPESFECCAEPQSPAASPLLPEMLVQQRGKEGMRLSRTGVLLYPLCAPHLEMKHLPISEVCLFL